MEAGGVPLATAEVVPGVWERAVALTTAATGEVRKPIGIACGAPLLLGSLAFLVAILVPDRVFAGAIVLLIIGWASATVAGSVRNPRLIGPLELYLDHDRHEEAEFRRDTGSKRPRTRRAMERWLLGHPTGPGRMAYLLVLGRLAEADRELAVRPRDPVCGDFLRENAVAVRILYTGGIPDLEPSRQAWARIEDPEQRRIRRQCLAIEEAMVAAASGRDPLPALAAGRREVGSVAWQSRVEWLVARAALTTLAFAAAGWLVRLAFGL